MRRGRVWLVVGGALGIVLATVVVTLIVTSTSESGSNVAPWWGVGVLTGGFTILGAFATQLYLSRKESARRLADRQEIFTKMSREAASSFLAEVDTTLHILLTPGGEPESLDLELARHRALNQIPFVASEAVTNASVKLIQALNEVMASARPVNYASVGRDEMNSFTEVRLAFINAVRSEEGLAPLSHLDVDGWAGPPPDAA